VSAFELTLLPAAESFALHFARVTGVLSLTPPLGEHGVTRSAVAGLAAWTSLALAAAAPAPVFTSPAALAASAAGELGLGLLLGFALRLALFPVEVAGAALAHESGLTLAGNLDPSIRTPMTPLESILRLLAILAFVGLGGLDTAIHLLARSFVVVPLGAAGSAAMRPCALELIPALIARASEAALELALPVIGAGFLASAVIAVLGRALPRLNLLSDALAVRTGAVLVALIAFLPFTVRATAWGLAALEPR
jgi:flagellar biosynthetic protein FliR